MLIFGGVYGNLEALHAVHRIAQHLNLKPDQVINTGDAVAYCADPAACIEFLAEWNPLSIAGNVELQLVEGAEDCGCGFNEGSVCDRLSQAWYPYLRSQLKPLHLRWMSTLPRTLKIDCYDLSAAAVHGSYLETSKYVFKSTPWEFKQRELEAAASDVIFAGHCGLPFLDSSEGKLWANPGAAGMPANDGTPRTWAIHVTPSDGGVAFETIAIEYDFESAQMKMRKVPELRAYSEALSSGLWPSLEVLSPPEAALRGQAILPSRLVLRK